MRSRPESTRSCSIDYTYDGPGIAKGGTGELKVDGAVVATGKQENSIAFQQLVDETSMSVMTPEAKSTGRTINCHSPSAGRSTS